MALEVLAGLSSSCAWTATFMKPENRVLVSGLYLAFCFFHLFVSRSSEAKGQNDENIHTPADYLPLGSMGFVCYMLAVPFTWAPPLDCTEACCWFWEGFWPIGPQASFRAPSLWDRRSGEFWFISITGQSSICAPVSSFGGLAISWPLPFLHTLYPIAYQRLRKSAAPFGRGFVAPLLGLILILVAMTACDLLSFLLWPFVLLLGMLGMSMAWLAGSFLAAGVTVLMVMVSLGVWLFRLPDPSGLTSSLMLVAAFTAISSSLVAARDQRKSLFKGNAFSVSGWTNLPEEAMQLPAMAALMPFALAMRWSARSSRFPIRPK